MWPINVQHATGQNYEPREGVREDVGHIEISTS